MFAFARFTPLAALPALAAASALFAAPVAAPVTAPAPAAAGSCAGRVKSDMWVTVIAEGLRNSQGKLVVTVYPDRQSRFLAKKGEVNVGKVDARQGTTRIDVCIPQAGTYAIAVYHDEDGDGHFKRGLLPKEGYGFSNNPSTLAGLPAFKAVLLKIPKSGLTTRIRMKYP